MTATGEPGGDGSAQRFAPGLGLGHVAVLVGLSGAGSVWPGDDLASRIDEWAKVVDHAGVPWLSVRPTTGTPANLPPGPAVHHVGGCTVIVDAAPDGRRRLAGVLAGLPGNAPEAAVSAALNHPAPTDPDLIVVVGPDHRLPASVVWELAYAELVYIEPPGDELTGRHIEDALAEFAHRHRRFGGLD